MNRDRKPHIGIFGRRNCGKSTLVNLLTAQDTAIVSDTPGTTTDPVKKSIEIPGIGACILIDTAGIDDVGSLGELRVKKTKSMVKQVDIAILLFVNNCFEAYEKSLIAEFEHHHVPYLLLHNKKDISPLHTELNERLTSLFNAPLLDFSSLGPSNIAGLINHLVIGMPQSAYVQPSILGDLVSYGDIVLLIVPIDDEAPEGRLILPQVQVIRDILDNDCISIVLKEREVDAFLRKTGVRPKLVITDSSLFLKADASIPKDIPLTGFSVLLARYKGEFQHYLNGTPYISQLKHNDKVLLLESCTHHVSCDDIGRIKLPRWISHFTGKAIEFETVTGFDSMKYPIQEYALVIQCGGCMVTRKQLTNRLQPAIDAGVPVTNYGMAIAYVQGVYDRAIHPFTGELNISSHYL